VISLRRDGQGANNELNGVRVFRVQKRVRDEKGKWAYFFRILRFFFRSAVLLTRKHLERPYDLVHVHSVPDFEVFAALVPKLLAQESSWTSTTSSRNCMATSSRSKMVLSFSRLWPGGESIHRVLRPHGHFERPLAERLVSRSVAREKCTSILNFPDGRLFCTNGLAKSHEKTVLMYPAR